MCASIARDEEITIIVNKMTDMESKKHLCLGKWAWNVPRAKARADGRSPKVEVDQDKQAMDFMQRVFSL